MNSNPPPRVFLSHPAEYKHTIALPLSQILIQRGISVSLNETELKPGDEAPENVQHGMATASIGIFILGPEFLAKFWTMKELNCFQRRVDEAKARGNKPPTLIPIFYGMTFEQCDDRSIFEYVNENTQAVFSKCGFFDRVSNGSTSVDEVLHAVGNLAKSTGIRNREGATNKATPEMERARGALIMRIVDHVVEAVRDADSPMESTYVEAYYDPDLFIPVQSMVPHNPYGIVLDFDSKREDGTPLTSEGQLHYDIVDTSPLASAVIIAQGEGGIGKTCAVRALGRRSEIRERFDGGIIYVTVGENANELFLINRVAHMVETAGGIRRAQFIRRVNRLREAVSVARTWFQGPTLFLIDDIWAMNGLSPATVKTLSKIARHERSRVVFTSRDTKLMAGGKYVIFKAKADATDPQSERILCSHARLPVPTSRWPKESYGKILLSCGGLPVALSVAGCIVFLLSRGFCHNRPEKAWLRHQEMWKDESAEIMEERLLISLKVLESEEGGNVYRTRFEAMGVLRNGQYVSMDILKRLWGIPLAEAMDVVSAFERVSVVRSIDAGGEYHCIKAFGLNNIMLGIAHRLALKRETLHEHGKRLLWSYYPVVGSNPNVLDQPIRLWWGSVRDDGYFFKSVCWLLKIIGREVDIDFMHLLTSAKWVVRQLTKCGEVQIATDIELAEQCALSPEWNSGRAENDRSWLRLLKSAVRLCKNEVLSSTWAGMPWFQLYGRLVSSVDNVPHVRKFLKEIEDEAPKPWLKPGEGCLLAAGGSLRDVVEFAGRFLCFRSRHSKISILHQDGKRVIISEYDLNNGTSDQVTLTEGCDDFIASACISPDGKAVVLGLDDGRVIISIDQPQGEEHNVVTQHGDQNNGIYESDIDGDVGSASHGSEIPMSWPTSVLMGHSGIVSCVGMSDDRTLVFSGSNDRSVRLWAKEGETWVASVLEGHTDDVTSVGMSGDGTRIVSGSDDCTVRVWRKVRRTWFACVLKGHESLVRSVWMSSDGERVVSGYYDGTVRVWEREGDKYVGFVLKGHNEIVNSVWIGNDGKKVISGSSDHAVRVWEKEEKGWVSSALEGHTANVSSVWLSEDRRVAVSGGWDCTVRVWKKEGEKWDGSALAGHNGPVASMVVSDDRVRVVSGSEDKTGRVWERSGEKWVSSVMEGHTDGITSVGMSSEGGRVVSGSGDTTVRIWKREGDKWDGFVLNGHEKGVSSVDVSRDGRRIVSGSWDRTVRVWDEREVVSHVGWLSRASGVRGRRETLWYESVLRGHTGLVESVGISEDGRRIVSASLDRKVRVWDVDGSGRWGCVFKVDVGFFLRTVEISGDGRTIIARSRAGGGRGGGITWKYEGEEWVEQIGGNDLLYFDGGWTEKTRVEKAVDAIEVQKTFCGYVMRVKRSPYIVFLDWVN